MGYRTYNCPVARRCGGCEWLNVPYEIQLRRKQAAVEELFGAYRGTDGQGVVEPIERMDEPLRCRNKIVVPFAPGGKRGFRFGLFERGSHKIVEKPDCLVEHQLASPVIATIAQLVEEFRLPAYDEDKGAGLVRYALARFSNATGQVLVAMVCASERFRAGRAFAKELRRRRPEVATVVLNINDRRTNAVLGFREQVLSGPGWITERLLGCDFRISASSFFQVNPRQAQTLFSTAVDFAQLSCGQTLIDAYCGTGSIGIIAAHAVPGTRLIGIESNARAVRDAQINARANGLAAARFINADASEHLALMAAQGANAHVVFMDPPRAGATERFLHAAAQLAPQRIVYISCNPATQVRDVGFLCSQGYRLQRVRPVDMFPHTKHTETVALLCRG